MDHYDINDLSYCRRVKEWLVKRYGKKQAYKIWKNTKAKYSEYLNDMPDIGGPKNGHADAIYGGQLIFAWYSSLPDQPPIEEIQDFVNRLFFGSFEKVGKVFDLNTGTVRSNGYLCEKDVVAKYGDSFIISDYGMQSGFEKIPAEQLLK